MHEQLTCRARKAIAYAVSVARKEGCGHIWPRHILLGLLADPSSHAYAILKKIVENIARLREAVEVTQEQVFSEERDEEGQDNTVKVMQYAKKEVDRIDYDHVGTEHLLAGLLQVDCWVVTTLLCEYRVTLDTVRREAHIVSFAASMSVLSSLATAVCRRDIATSLLASLKRYDRLIDELDREVFLAAHDPCVTNPDQQKDRALDPNFQPEIKITRDEVMVDRNALARILKLKPRYPHSFEPRDY